MLTIIAFLLTILGCVNWLLIGLLQYDFIAGIFGFQSSIFSRIIYIVIGAASVFIVFKLIKNKGTLPVFSRRNKKDLAMRIEKMKHKETPLASSENTEASEEIDLEQIHKQNHQAPSEPPKGLFDEHFDERKWLWAEIFPL